LTYLDSQSRKNKRSGTGAGSDDDDDDDPPPDPDEAPVASSSKGKGKEKKPAEMREINVSTRKTDDKGMTQGLSTVRREMLQIIRAEEEEEWLNYEYHNVTVRNIFTGVPVLTSGI